MKSRPLFSWCAMPSDEQDPLQSLIADILEAENRGEFVDRDAMIGEHPDLADSLHDFFANHDRMKSAVESEDPTLSPSGSGLDDPTIPPGRDSQEEATMPPQPVGDDPTIPPTEGASQPAEPAVGDQVGYFGDYELLEEIARGGMGIVFKARQVNLNRIVALKMILAGQFAGQEDVQRFYTEAEAAANLDQPGIVPIFEIGEHEGQHYFSMGYVEGESLAQKVADGPLPPREAAGLVKKICDAMAYAHERGVIHRDLKPANILIDLNSQPKVTDFGLAKRTEADSGLTGTGQILGTPAYMPPEQASGKADVGPLADVYSLGAILYCLVTGRPPFQAASPMDTLLQVLDKEPVAPRVLNESVPKDLETICLKCLSKDASRRYPSAAALGQELNRYLEGEPILARPVGGLERTWRWCNRNPLIASLILTTASSLLAGIGVSAYLAVVANARANLAVQESGRADKNAMNALAQEQLAKQRADEATNAREIAERNARNAQAERLSTLAQSELSQNRPNRSLLLAAQAIDATRTAKEPAVLSARKAIRHAVESLHGAPFGDRPYKKLLLSSDGEWLATISEGGSLKVFSERSIFPTSRTISIALDPPCEDAVDGIAEQSLLAVADSQGSIHVYRCGLAVENARIATFTGADSAVHRMSFGSDGKYLAASFVSGQISCWQIEDRKQIFSFTHPNHLTIMKFSPDGRWLLTASNDTNFYRYIAMLHPLASGQDRPRYRLKANTNSFLDAVFKKDGSELITSNGDGKLRRWDLTAEDPSSMPIVVKTKFSQSQYGLQLSADDRWLCSVRGNGEVALLDLLPEAPSQPSGPNPDPSPSPIPSSNPSRYDMIVLNVSAQVEKENGLGIRYGELGLQPYSFSPDSKRFAVGDQDGDVHIWELADVRDESSAMLSRQTAGGHEGPVTALKWRPSGRALLLTAGVDNSILSWQQNSATKKLDSIAAHGHDAMIHSLHLVNRNATLLSHDRSGRIRKWMAGDLKRQDAAGITLMANLARSNGYVAETSARLFMRTNDFFFKQYDLHSSPIPTITKSFHGHELGAARELLGFRKPPVYGQVRGTRLLEIPQLFAYGDKCGLLATSLGISRDLRVSDQLFGKVRVWNMEQEDPSGEPEFYAPFESPVTALAISPSGRWLGAGTLDGQIVIYDRRDRENRADYPFVMADSSSAVSRLQFSESELWLMAETKSATAYWKLTDRAASPVEVESLRNHRGHFSPDGRWLATIPVGQQAVKFISLADPVGLGEPASRRELPWSEKSIQTGQSTNQRWWFAFSARTAGPDNVCVFDLNSDAPGSTMQRFTIESPYEVMVSDDGHWLFSCSRQELEIMRMSGTEETVNSRFTFPIPGRPSGIAYHTDSQRLALAFRSRPTHVWDLSQTVREMGPELVGKPCEKIWLVDDGKSLLSFLYDRLDRELTRVRIDFLDSEYLCEKSPSIAMRRLSNEERELFRLDSMTANALREDPSAKDPITAEFDSDRRLDSVRPVPSTTKGRSIEQWGTVVDPDGDCIFDAEDGSVAIQIPSTPHGLSVEIHRMNAPRLVQEVDGDFALEVSLGGNFIPGAATVPGRAGYKGAGLLVMQDNQNYIRLERAALRRNGNTRHYVNFELRRHGQLMRFGSSDDFPIDPDASCRLRLERVGDEIRGAVSQGDGWQSLTPKESKLNQNLRVGILAVNASGSVFNPRFSDFVKRELEMGSGELEH